MKYRVYSEGVLGTVTEPTSGANLLRRGREGMRKREGSGWGGGWFLLEVRRSMTVQRKCLNTMHFY